MAACLVTGAGSGFGKEIAPRIADRGEHVIATVDAWAQVPALEAEARERKVALVVGKLDVTDEGDQLKASEWDVDVLLNAGTNQGGAVAGIPAKNMRLQSEVNVIGPALLTQGVVKRLIARKCHGRIVFMSPVVGLSDPFNSFHCASRQATEADADALSIELKKFGIAVATINPGPFLTGFKDRGFDVWRSWIDHRRDRLFDHPKLAAPFEQFDPEPVYETGVKVLMGETDFYRDVEPKSMISGVKEKLDAYWTRKTTDELGERAPEIAKAYEMKPKRPAADG